MQFNAIMTDLGLSKIAQSSVSGETVGIKSMAVGDGNGGYYEVTTTQSELSNEVWRGDISNIYRDASKPNRVVVWATIPANVGGITLREVGILNDEGELLGVSLFPEKYKPAAREGAVTEVIIQFVIDVENADVIELTVNPSVIYATQEYVDESISEVRSSVESHVSNADLHLREGEREVIESASAHISNDVLHLREGERDQIAASDAHTRNGELHLAPGERDQIAASEIHRRDVSIHLAPGERAMIASVGDVSELRTQDKTSLVAAVNEVFIDVDNGLRDVANAVTDKGVHTPPDAGFATIVNNVRAIQTGKKMATGYVRGTRLPDKNDQISITGLDFLPRYIIIRSPNVVTGSICSIYIHKTEFPFPLQNDMSFYISSEGSSNQGVIDVSEGGFTIKTGNPLKGTASEDQEVYYNWIAFS